MKKLLWIIPIIFLLFACNQATTTVTTPHFTFDGKTGCIYDTIVITADTIDGTTTINSPTFNATIVKNDSGKTVAIVNLCVTVNK